VTAESVRLLGPDLEVVIDGRELPIEGEREIGLGLEHLEHPVHEVHELRPKALEWSVPLAVPVGVRDEVDGGSACSAVDRHVPAEPSGSELPAAYDE
jgi:hypothetical protein